MHVIHLLAIHRLWRDLRGATSIEYSLIVALIAIGSIGVMGTVGTKLRSPFTNVSNALRVS